MDRADLRLALLKAALTEVPFEGWTRAAFAAAARELGLDAAEYDRAFPDGVREAIDLWTAVADEEMLAELGTVDLAALKMRARISLAVKIRLMQNADHREALRRALSVLALPTNAGLACRLLYRTVDSIWFGIGDRATDFSFYSKRALLAAVYSATVLYWLDDRSDGFAETWSFLDRRIADVMRLPKVFERIKHVGDFIPNPFMLFRQPGR
jgi:ubiquinone biosynthesis protein COQ9